MGLGSELVVSGFEIVVVVVTAVVAAVIVVAYAPETAGNPIQHLACLPSGANAKAPTRALYEKTVVGELLHYPAADLAEHI